MRVPLAAPPGFHGHSPRARGCYLARVRGAAPSRRPVAGRRPWRVIAVSDAQPGPQVRQPLRARRGVWRRLAPIGWRGLILRFEALLLLRRILPALERNPFAVVRLELMPEATPAPRGAAGPAAQGVASAHAGRAERVRTRGPAARLGIDVRTWSPVRVAGVGGSSDAGSPW